MPPPSEGLPEGQVGRTDGPSVPVPVPPPPGTDGLGLTLSGGLHPAALALWPLEQAAPLLVLLGVGSLEPALAGLVLVVSAGLAIARYLRFSWRVEHGALVIEQGLVQRRRRVIPIDRVQSVDLVRKLRHRVFGVVEVRVEAVGGDSSEGRIDAIGPRDAQRLRAALLPGRDQTPPGVAGADQPSGAQLVRMRPGRLVVAGLTGGRVGVAAALLGFAGEVLGERVTDLLQRVPGIVGGARGLLALAIAVLIAAFLISIAATVVAYWDFTVVREGSDLHIRRGLLEQRLDTLPLRRLQALRVEENLVRRLFGLATVKVDVAGQAGRERGRESGLLLPLGSRAEALALVEEVLDAPGLGSVGLRPMPARARTRRLMRGVLVAAAATAVAVALAGTPGAAALALGPPAVAAALAAYRALGHGEHDGVLVARSGLLVRRTAFVPSSRLQSLALTASPWQRRRRLATLELQIARSPGVWSGPRLIDLDAESGRHLLARLAAEQW